LNTYATYHSNVKLCYSLGIEKQIFSEEFLDKIPNTTSHYWKTKKAENFCGSEYEEISNCSLQELKIIADMRAKHLRKMFVSFCRLYFICLNILGIKNFQKLLKNNKKTLLPYIENLIAISGNKRMVLKLLKISPHQFGSWQKMKKYECRESLIWLCYKRVSRQISMKEILVMKSLLKESKYLHWSSASVWGKAVKDGKISMSVQSWYHYAKLLGLGLKRNKFYKKRKRISVRTDKPNAIWHMDVTRYKTVDNFTMYIYTIMDNFSRKILSWDVSENLSGKMRLKSLEKAVKEQFLEKQVLDDRNLKLDLIVDGGSENNNITIHEFIKNCRVGIDKKIALKDVLFSNSLIEGNNRILKQTYLKDQQLTRAELTRYISESIQEYNSEKPHYVHKIYTPDEVFENPELKDTKLFFDKLNQRRILDNKNYSCGKVCV
jgi:transposase InsO family protein